MEKRKRVFKNFLKGFWIFYALASVIITTISADKLITKDYSGISKYVPLDDLWDIVINDELYSDVSLDSFHFDTAGKGDIILMQRKIPDDWQTSEGVLRIHTKQAAVEVFINGQMVYEYGYDRFMEGKTVGTGYQFVDFPNKYSVFPCFQSAWGYGHYVIMMLF